MREVIRYIISACLIILFQVLIFNKLSVGYGIYILLTPVFLLVLPFRMKLHYMLIIAFVMGITLDIFMNTYGLQASALLLVAYLRPIIFQFVSPSDEYIRGDNTSKYSSYSKFITILFFILLLHNIWYFTLENFNIDNFSFTAIRIGLSLLASLILSVLTFMLFFSERHLHR